MLASISLQTGFWIFIVKRLFIKSVSLQLFLYILKKKKNFSPGGRPNTTPYPPKAAVEPRQYVGLPKTPLHNWMTGAKREPMESIGEFQAHRKPVESLDDDLVVPSMELNPEHHKSLKEKDFRKLRTTEEDFVFPYGSHASFFVCRSFLQYKWYFF